MIDRSRDFWIRETGTGQQVAQLHERLMMMMMMTWNLQGTINYRWLTSMS